MGGHARHGDGSKDNALGRIVGIVAWVLGIAMMLGIGAAAASAYWFTHPRVVTVTKTLEAPLTADQIPGINRLMHDLQKQGLPEMTIAAIAGNVYGESAGETSILESKDTDSTPDMTDMDAVEQWAAENGTGVGMLQWTGDRTHTLMDYARGQGKAWDDADLQTEYLLRELHDPAYWTSTDTEGFWHPTSVVEATRIMEEHFVRPADPEKSLKRRAQAALEVYGALQLENLGNTDDSAGDNR